VGPTFRERQHGPSDTSGEQIAAQTDPTDRVGRYRHFGNDALVPTSSTAVDSSRLHNRYSRPLSPHRAPCGGVTRVGVGAPRDVATRGARGEGRWDGMSWTPGPARSELLRARSEPCGWPSATCHLPARPGGAEPCPRSELLRPRSEPGTCRPSATCHFPAGRGLTPGRGASRSGHKLGGRSCERRPAGAGPSAGSSSYEIRRAGRFLGIPGPGSRR
jgi:hypothetical protein